MNNPIILALDYSDLSEASNMLSKVRNHIGMIKIGTQLFTAQGKESFSLAKQFHIPIFLDLKLHDVPTTVSKTVEVICELLANVSGDHFLSIHCFGGKEMCRAAFETTKGSNVSIVGVTTLTSLSERDFGNMGFRDCRPGIRTIDLAYLGADCLNEKAQYDNNKQRILSGLTHFVCAPNQLNLMRQHLGVNMVFITPGIRAESDEENDHKRNKPASFAIRNGADWIVVGRPITKSSMPEQAAIALKAQVDRAR